MYDTILVPADGRDEVAAALDQAVTLAKTYGATVHALYVVDDSRGSSGLMGIDDRDPLESLRRDGENAVKNIARKARDEDVTVTTAVRQNIPHQGIQAYADEHDIDLIVMSSRRHSGLRRALLGSVTERLLRVTDRAVLVVNREVPGS